jgi:hypothetical protein
MKVFKSPEVYQAWVRVLLAHQNLSYKLLTFDLLLNYTHHLLTTKKEVQDVHECRKSQMKKCYGLVSARSTRCDVEGRDGAVIFEKHTLVRYMIEKRSKMKTWVSKNVRFSHHGLVRSGRITMRYKTLWLCGCLVSLMIQIACVKTKKAWAFWLWVLKSVQEYIHVFVRSCETEIWYKRLWTSRLLSTTHLNYPCDQSQSRTRPWVFKTETIRHYEFECSWSTSMR